MHVLTRRVEKIMDLISKEVSTFLKENGGFKNGYDTYLNGKFMRHYHKAPTWSTPNCQDLTKREIAKKAMKLDNKIQEILIENSFEYDNSIIIKVESYHIEHGCYRINISTTKEKEIRII